MNKHKDSKYIKSTKRPLINKILADELNPYKFAIFIFLIVCALDLVLDLFVGVSMGAYYLGDTNLGDKLKVSEIPGRLPYYFVTASIIAILGFLILNESQKSKRKKE